MVTRIKSIVAAAMAGAMLCACSPPRLVDGLDYAGELDAHLLAGCWVISDTSLRKVVRLGYTQYTNKWDHVILLNEDGTCVFRTFEAFSRKSNFEEEGIGQQQLYELFVGDEFKLLGPKLPHNELGARSWCLSYSNRWPFVSGPYARTNAVVPKQEVWRANRWNQWKLMDHGPDGKGFEGFGDCAPDHRYQIAFSNSNLLGCAFGVGQTTNDFFLWSPVTSWPGIVTFERATPRTEENAVRSTRIDSL
jgi:hypothetical protein